MASRQSVVFCYAAADAALVHETGAYLESNLLVQPCYDEGLIEPGEDLVEATARGLSAEWTVVVLSPDSLAKPMKRERWEPAWVDEPKQLGSNLVFLLARECRFPALLRRELFVDCSRRALDGWRELKRTVLKQPLTVREAPVLPPLEGDIESSRLEEIRAVLADRPGSLEAIDRVEALPFAHRCQEEFEGTFWIDCAYRSRAGILGDTAYALGLTLAGSLEQNASALREFCTQRRCLFVYEHLAPGDRNTVEWGGLASLVVTAPSPPRPLLPREETAGLFARWRHHPGRSLVHLADADHHLREGDVALGTAALTLLKHYERLAEAAETIELLIEQETSRLNQEAVMRLKWERSWITGHWGEPSALTPEAANPPSAGQQLGLNFR